MRPLDVKRGLGAPAIALRVERRGLLWNAQRRRDLEVELAGMQAGGIDISALEKAFVKVGKSYAERKAISYAAFREFGVPADILKRAGISRAA